MVESRRAVLKDELQKLNSKKQDIEAEIDACVSRLNAPGGPGLTESLVDAEGYPRADVDVARARTDRHQVAVLSNDHKDVMARIESLLHELHALTRDEVAAQRPMDRDDVDAKKPRLNDGAVLQDVDMVDSGGTAFAVIDDVSPTSPAAVGGLKCGDRVCRFGGVGRDEGLAAIAAVVQGSVGRGVEVVVIRDGVPLRLTVVPQQWSGRGLLGCHLQPL